MNSNDVLDELVHCLEIWFSDRPSDYIDGILTYAETDDQREDLLRFIKTDPNVCQNTIMMKSYGYSLK